MVRIVRVLSVASVALLLVSSALDGSQQLRMRVTPRIAVAPAVLTVELSIEAHQDNRAIRVVAESDDYYRSSEIQLEGQQGPRLNVFEFRNLPPGTYQVTGVLVGANGPRAEAQLFAQVAATAGRR